MHTLWRLQLYSHKTRTDKSHQTLDELKDSASVPPSQASSPQNYAHAVYSVVMATSETNMKLIITVTKHLLCAESKALWRQNRVNAFVLCVSVLTQCYFTFTCLQKCMSTPMDMSLLRMLQVKQ